MSDDPTLNDTAQSNHPGGGRDLLLEPNGRVCGGSSATSRTDLGEFLDHHVYPALAQRLDRAFPEYGFRRCGNAWLASQEVTRDLPGAPRPDRVYCYDNRPWGS